MRMKHKLMQERFRQPRAIEALPIMDRSGAPARTAMIYQSELDFISRCILDYTSIETGGQLFGYWTATGVPVVLFAIGPGPKANHQVAFFNQDVDYLMTIGSCLIAQYGLQHIGEWHSHHRLGLAHPSGHDAATMVTCIERQNLGRFLLCIGNCTNTHSTLNAFNFTQDAGTDYLHAAWDVKAGTSPFRTLVDGDMELKQVIDDPKTEQPCHVELKRVSGAGSFCRPAYAHDYWLKDKHNNLVLKQIVDRVSAVSDSGTCAVKVDSAGLVHLAFEHRGRKAGILFPQGFPDVPPLVETDGVMTGDVAGRWNYAGDIYLAFEDYCQGIFMTGGKDDTQSI